MCLIYTSVFGSRTPTLPRSPQSRCQSCYNGARTLLAFLPKGLSTRPRKGAIDRAQSQQIAAVWVAGREGEQERAERSDRRPLTLTFGSLLTSWGSAPVNALGLLGLMVGVQVAGWASNFSPLGSLCSSKTSGGLFPAAVGSVGGNSLGRLMPSHGRSVGTETLEVLVLSSYCRCFCLQPLLPEAAFIGFCWPVAGLGRFVMDCLCKSQRRQADLKTCP